ncbi:tRNA (guanosine(37)-N1)-methyltransferase TrmD [Lachnoclostridium phytofermentans]|uniref:tRNA (guanine-N(1)-)-methyltransferase n=1 Tax=Lachnoclostridium phytofermentans (strain ATCC 700394 / DSM 18823 / ISDg) TaxID=357809 RepID=TRMD_LACP7|nr:tRNA (guanosine(37)-N1)-methyltransferase TrmD [Lachnoclostridium phytofermentans]A9KLM2.1 RecName: Full=tRNA (guanine-N(1)-)-methyltransferase; AltName: Full=M1G-methyltransferase; AltName: Full=tRNA [GM37] methyltransferase [Lachnoclostridium phytofermentans ISDg]ABX42766.1 tRNA (guanine-N1)-methyltransferase [Lachnoclostridium phytofermentans ISDg]
MNYHVMTLFPDMIHQAMNTSIIGRAMEKGLLTINAIDIREFSEDKHRRVDDYPYGGGAGMVMAPGPVYRTYEHVMKMIDHNKEMLAQDKTMKIPEESVSERKNETRRPRVIYLTPQGKVFHQKMAEEFAKEDDLVFLCGHYEGIDERVLDQIVTDYVSIGDYILTGGELPVMVMMDAISRLIPGVLNNNASAEFESLQDNLLEYPQYTRPEVFMEQKVPDVLLSGHHANIEKWRREQSIIRTLKNRPELLEEAVLSKKEKQFLEQLRLGEDSKNV